MLKDTKQFYAKIKSCGTRGVTLENDYGSLVQFTVFQIEEHGNATPAMTLRDAIPTFVAKPTGFSQRAFVEYIDAYTEFTFDKKAKKFTKVQGKNTKALPEANPYMFWKWEREEEQSVWMLDEKMAQVIKRAIKEGYSDADIELTVQVQIRQARMNDPKSAVAATLGIAV